MILRRISEGMKNQDWFVVLVEVMIVVVGIFIGLQVDDWNESRKDRQREIRYLERIDVDLEKDIESIERAIGLMEDRVRYGRFLLEAIDTPALVESYPQDFILAIEHTGYTFTPDVSDQTFDEIKFAGDLAIIESEALRNALSKYYVLRFRSEQWNYSREYTQTTYKVFQFGILNADQTLAMADAGGTDVVFSVEEARGVYERMLERPDFIGFIPYTIMRRMRSRNRFNDYFVAATELREEIASELATPRGAAQE